MKSAKARELDGRKAYGVASAASSGSLFHPIWDETVRIDGVRPYLRATIKIYGFIFGRKCNAYGSRNSTTAEKRQQRR